MRSCKFVVPNIPGSAPLPASLVFLYLMLTTSGFIIFATLSAESKEAFWGPIQRFLTGENIGGLQAVRYGVLILFPLLVGWQTYNSTAVSDAPPSENRTIHPAPPGEYTGLSSPVAKTPDNIQQGKGFYAAFCSPATEGTSMARVRLPGDSILPGQLFRSNDDRHAPGKLSLLAHQEGRRRPPDRRDAMEIRNASLGSRTS